MIISIELLEKLVTLRRDLHKNPELSGMEVETAERIATFLETYHPEEIIRNLGGKGLAVVFDFPEKGPTVMIRSELDALPIQEINKMDYRSKFDGVSHKCGHDGHMAILAGVGALLSTNNIKKGRVVLLFQPAEENGEGAFAVLKDKKFSSIEPDYVIALHNLPGYNKNMVVCRKDHFTAAVKSMVLTLKGKTSHAGEPENGINPAQTIARIIQIAAKLEHRTEDEMFALVTPIHIKMGEEAYGISAGYGEVHFTLRSWTNEKMEELCSTMEKESEKIAEEQGLDVEAKYLQEFSATENDPPMADIVASIAEEAGLTFEAKEWPFRWGEDFGLFTRKYKGVMFGIGSGKTCPALHNPDYDFPDDILPVGIKMFSGMLQKILN